MPAMFSDGGKLPLQLSRRRYPLVTRVFTDGGYAGRLVKGASDKTHITLEIIRRGAHAKGLRGPATPMGRRAHFCMDLQEPTPCPRL